MKYIVEAFDKRTELLDFEVELPEGCDAKLSAIMGWASVQRGDEGYDLSSSQIDAIEKLAGRSFHDDLHIFQLTCNV